MSGAEQPHRRSAAAGLRARGSVRWRGALVVTTGLQGYGRPMNRLGGLRVVPRALLAIRLATASFAAADGVHDSAPTLAGFSAGLTRATVASSLPSSDHSSGSAEALLAAW